MDESGIVGEENWTGVFEGARLNRAPKQASCKLSGEAVILNLESGIYYGLNDVGARIWDLLSEPRDVVALRDALIEEYEVDAGTLQRDLIAILTSLVDSGLIQVSGDKQR